VGLAGKRLLRHERRLRPIVLPEAGFASAPFVDLQRSGQRLIPIADATDPEEEFRVGGGAGIGVLANREVGRAGGDRGGPGGDAIRVLSEWDRDVDRILDLTSMSQISQIPSPPT